MSARGGAGKAVVRDAGAWHASPRRSVGTQRREGQHNRERHATRRATHASPLQIRPWWRGGVVSNVGARCTCPWSTWQDQASESPRIRWAGHPRLKARARCVVAGNSTVHPPHGHVQRASTRKSRKSTLPATDPTGGRRSTPTGNRAIPPCQPSTHHISTCDVLYNDRARGHRPLPPFPVQRHHLLHADVSAEQSRADRIVGHLQCCNPLLTPPPPFP